MEDYWIGICVGWFLGVALTWWLDRGLIKALKDEVSALHGVIEKIKQQRF